AQVARASTTTSSGDEPRPRWERVIALIDVGEDDCYAVSVERIAGGEEHWWSFHGTSGETEMTGVDLTAQGGGTVAGPEIAYRDTAAAAKKLGDGVLSCMALMPNPSRGAITGPWEMTQALKDQDRVYLRVTSLGPVDGELWTATCSAPGGASYYNAPWTVVRRRGPAPLVSEFVSVIEPYEGERVLKSVEPLHLTGDAPGPFQPCGLRVTGDGFTDTIIIQPEGGYACATPRGMTTDAEFAFWRERDGRLDAAVVANGTTLVWNDEGVVMGRPGYTGAIESCDWTTSTVRVRLADGPAQTVDVGAAGGQRTAQVQFVGMTAADASALVGRFVHIRGRPAPPAEPGQDVTYRIEAATPVEGGVELKLNLDPRIGEGPVKSSEDGKLVSGALLRMYPWHYFAGKHLANEDASAIRRLSDVPNGTECLLDAAEGALPAAQLADEFGDRDGDGLKRFVIYDYGPGDQVTIPCWVAVSAADQ
ncbi:MAG TPA: hypothetical protein VM283_02975, partial [Armatimonadota bacterium]|nr:hypothetical protein [Armatimonadota bacterium]